MKKFILIFLLLLLVPVTAYSEVSYDLKAGKFAPGEDILDSAYGRCESISGDIIAWNEHKGMGIGFQYSKGDTDDSDIEFQSINISYYLRTKTFEDKEGKTICFYGGGGFGYYGVNIDFDEFGSFKEKTFGAHILIGAELPLSDSISLIAEGKISFANVDTDDGDEWKEDTDTLDIGGSALYLGIRF